jgi:hypothetical protein
MRMRPDSNVSRRLIVRHSVDLPEPDGPRTTMTSPRPTVRLMSLSTCRSPKCLLTFSISTIGWPVGLSSASRVGSGVTRFTSSMEGTYLLQGVRGSTARPDVAES